MKRTLILALTATALFGMASISQAQVFVRAPFVRVFVGQDGSVGVRAPFVNFYNGPGPYYYDPLIFERRVIVGTPSNPVMPPATETLPAPNLQPIPQQPVVPAPLPAIKNDFTPPPPQPLLPVQAAPTLDTFAKNFQPKEGSYEVTIINPLTNQPTQVRFLLPQGTPRRVIVRRTEIEFVYSLRQFVRIEFDRDGAKVTSR